MGKISELLVRQQIFPSSLFAFHFFLLPLQANNQFINKLWTITRRKITIRNGGGQVARLLIPLPQ